MIKELKKWYLKDKTKIAIWYPLRNYQYNKYKKNLVQRAKEICEKNKDSIPDFDLYLNDIKDDDKEWYCHSYAYRHSVGAMHGYGSGVNMSTTITGKINAYYVVRYLAFCTENMTSMDYGVQWELTKR